LYGIKWRDNLLRINKLQEYGKKKARSNLRESRAYAWKESGK
jgi:hypothetical protein